MDVKTNNTQFSGFIYVWFQCEKNNAIAVNNKFV